MAAAQIPNGRQQFCNGAGQPLAGGSVTFYIPGTTTPKDTWQDFAKAVLNTNPVLLDGNGEAVIWGSGYYRQIVQDANSVSVWDQVVYSGVPDATTVAQLPDPASVGAGARGFVIDATVNTFASVAVGGGSHAVPVWTDNVTWYIG